MFSLQNSRFKQVVKQYKDRMNQLKPKSKSVNKSHPPEKQFYFKSTTELDIHPKKETLILIVGPNSCSTKVIGRNKNEESEVEKITSKEKSKHCSSVARKDYTDHSYLRSRKKQKNLIILSDPIISEHVNGPVPVENLYTYLSTNN